MTPSSISTPLATFRSRSSSSPGDLPLKLGYPQLPLGDQRAVFRDSCAGDREFSCDLQSLRALDRQRLFQGDDIIRNRFAIGIDARQWTTKRRAHNLIEIWKQLCVRSLIEDAP